MTHHARRQHRGFSLVEILLAITLFGVFGVIAMRLLRTNFQVAQSTIDAENTSARFDTAVAVLQADLAGASSCELTPTGAIRIHRPGNQTLIWQANWQSLIRMERARSDSWNLGKRLQLKLDGSILLLSSSDDPANPIAFAPGGTRP